MPKNTIYTSIPSEIKRKAQDLDYGDVYQRECLRSWQDGGFDVVSVNPESELQALKKKNLGVRLVSNGTIDGKTKITDMLSLIRASGDAVAGIINADCYLLNPGGCIGEALKAAIGSLVLLERLNIDPVTMYPTTMYCGGFDGFFFDTGFLNSSWDEENWTIGSPNWDYWFPLAMHIKGASLKKPDALVLMHLNHPANWSRNEYLTNAKKLWHWLRSMGPEWFPHNVAEKINAYSDNGDPSEQDIEHFLDTTADWIFSSRESFSLCPQGGSGDFILRILASLETRMSFG